MTATITPKSSTSIIFVIVNQAGVVKTSGNASNAVNIILDFPNGSNIILGYAVGYTGTSIENYNSVPGQGVYTHGTLSPITFKTRFNSFANAASARVQDSGARSQITLIEVAN